MKIMKQLPEQIYYKGNPICVDKQDKNYIPPSIPHMEKECENCKGTMKMRPLDVPYMAVEDGFYLVSRSQTGKLILKQDIINGFLYGCETCSLGETVILSQKEEKLLDPEENEL